jgi:bifunctional non-homologous end joining protein LigD
MAKLRASRRPKRRGTARATSQNVSKLAKYRAKRDFHKTPEPTGGKPSKGGHSFVIQKHAARRLHYDFRLELDGVLLSWSVPKGPSLKAGDKRLAVRTEDHPLDYASFEGIIPQGEYGGGTVVVWDRGSWQPEGDAREGMKKGRLTFSLDGEKLHGRWHLIRTKGDGKQESWLLFKSRDEAANDNIEIVDAEPKSVISGRTIEEVARDADRTWHSNKKAEPTVTEKRAMLFRNVRAANDAKKRGAGKDVPEERKDAGDVAALVKHLPLGFELTNLDKVLYPEIGLTKAQLIAYLAVVADHMLPHVGNRPLTLVRCPEGRAKPCFFQKKIYPGAPKAIETVMIAEEQGTTVPYMKVRDMPGLVGLAQLGTLEIHIWGCHADKVERPDFMVFDLDPDPNVPWERVALAAFEVRKRLGELGLDSWVKTTGGKGLHVCLPVERKLDWDEFKGWSKLFAERLEADLPKQFTSNMAKSARKGRIFLDYLRNGRNATFIAPFSPRAREGAPVSVPITWDELAAGIEPSAWTITTVPQRLASVKSDPWADIYATKQALKRKPK